MLTEKIMDELIVGLRDILKDNIIQIILYGSAARNEETEQSDIDVAMIPNHEQDFDTRGRFITWAA